MNALRLFLLTSIAATVSAPLACLAAPAGDAAAACASGQRSLLERRIGESATNGMAQLIAFVHRTQPIYQLTVDDAVAWYDADRERRLACMRAEAARSR